VHDGNRQNQKKRRAKMIRNFFKAVPWTFLLPVAILLALTPFKPEPHLVEKLRMLVNGQLARPVDIFDLFMHGGPILLAFVKFFLERNKAQGDEI
jgi:hypothetical protein